MPRGGGPDATMTMQPGTFGAGGSPAPVRGAVFSPDALALARAVVALEEDPQIQLVCITGQRAELDRAIAEDGLDVVLVHGDDPCALLTTWLRPPGHVRARPALLMVAPAADRGPVIELLTHGADGVVLPDTEPAALRAAMRASAEGSAPVDARAARYVLEWMTGGAIDISFTPREREVLGLVAAGLLNKQIARQLSISTATVKAHLTRIYERLGVHDRTAAAAWAQNHGITGTRADPTA